MKQPLCFKNPEKPSCIDLILIKRLKCFQSTCVIETGLSDFHRMTVSVLKIHFQKLPHIIISYGDFYNSHNANSINSLTEVVFQDENTEFFVKDPD